MSNLNGEDINSNASFPTNHASFAGMFNVSAVPHTIPQAVPLQTVVRHTAASEKPPKFAGTEFKLWQQKMHFYLTTLQLVKYLTEECPAVPTETPDDRDALMAIDVWQNGDYLCRNYILSCLHDSLYGIYVGTKTSKELWKSLEKKYKMEDAGTKKFVVTKFLEYVMTDSKTVVSQAEEFQKILHEIEAEGMVLSESFQVAAMIDKLPPRWKDFKNYLKHKRKEMSLENLIVRLCIEENNKKSEGKLAMREVEPKANIVENSKRLSGTKRKEYGNSSNTKRPDARRPEKRTFVGKCFNCQKTGHRATECRSKKRPPQANLAVVENLASNVSHMHLSAVVSEVNLATNVKDWWVDTGATRHICADRELFSKYEKLEENERLFMGNSAVSNVVGKGEVILKFTSGVELTLMDVFHVPDIRKNLISGSILSKKGFKMVFESDKFVLTKAGMFVGKGYLIDGLFKANAIVIDRQSKFLYPQMINKTKSSAYLLESSDLWHGRLGHANLHALKKMAHLGLIPNFDIDKNHKCEICVEAKFAKPPFKSVERTSKPLELIHSDLCDLKYVQSRGGKKYFITFIDDHTRYCYVYLLSSKDEALNTFIKYKNEVENQMNQKIKILRSDRGGEYESNDFDDFCANHGIVHQTTAPYSPQQNGMAERKNRTLKNMVNAMLITSGAPQELWGEAILTANFILNRIPNKKGGIPYELWKGRLPNVKFLKMWGCLAKVAIPLPKKTKLGSKTVDCVFIGYALNSAACRFLVRKSDHVDIHVGTIMESRDASFFEDIFPYKKDEINVGPKRTREIANPESETNDSENEPEPRRGKRSRISKTFGPDFVSFLMEKEPETYKEAMSNPEAPFWKEAINDELESIMSHQTWELVDLPEGSKPIGSKWVFKRKLKPDGSIDKYKARLVAKGYRQKEGIDYFDTYSPVTRITSIRTLIAVAALHNLHIHQMDVKTAFLNGELEEEIYMEQPEGFKSKGQENKVCKLIKSLYGLKQAPKQWNEKFDSVMTHEGFNVNECDNCVYSKTIESDCVIICLYVDDMLIFGTNTKIIESTKKLLSNKFDMKDLGEVDVILGIKVSRNERDITLSQSHYVEKIIERFKEYDIKEVSNPFLSHVHIQKNQGNAVRQLEYSQVIGSLMYLMNCTRPDIAYSVSKLSRYTCNPGREHWAALMRVLGYVKRTKDYSIHFSNYPAVVEGYSDANWISDSHESKSTSGYVFTLGGGAISWKSSKQTCIPRSTMEAEFIALDKTGEEAEWLRQFLEHIPLWPKPVPAICIHCDSQAAIASAQNRSYNGKSRHIRRRHNTVKQWLSQGIISIDFIRSKDNLADPFTKGLSKERIDCASKGMGLKPIR